MSVRATDVFKTYVPGGGGSSRIDALKGVSIDINEGSLSLVHGPTGSGKTTLLAVLAGIVPPTSGEIVFDRIHLSRATESQLASFRERCIGYVPQTPLLIRDLTLLENILAPNVFLSRTVGELSGRALGLLGRLGLERKADRRPHELSGGERRICMVLRALLKDPLYIFADEPVSELDGASSEAVLGLLSERRDNGSAVVIATHMDLKLDGRVSTYTLREGKIAGCAVTSGRRSGAPGETVRKVARGAKAPRKRS